MGGCDFVISKREMHQFVHVPHQNHVSIEEDDALSEKGLGHAKDDIMHSTYIVTCQLKDPGFMVQKFEDAVYPIVSPQLRPGVREPGIVS